MLEELSKVANRYGVIHQGKLIKEFTSEELMKSTSTAIQIETSDNEAAIKVLQARQIDATLTGRFIIVKDATSSSSVIKILSEANIDVHNFETIKEGIENYYLKLIGGIQNEQAN
jgi:ABC-2 type transport system ATP-binding protein